MAPAVTSSQRQRVVSGVANRASASRRGSKNRCTAWLKCSARCLARCAWRKREVRKRSLGRAGPAWPARRRCGLRSRPVRRRRRRRVRRPRKCAIGRAHLLIMHDGPAAFGRLPLHGATGLAGQLGGGQQAIADNQRVGLERSFAARHGFPRRRDAAQRDALHLLLSPSARVISVPKRIGTRWRRRFSSARAASFSGAKCPGRARQCDSMSASPGAGRAKATSATCAPDLSSRSATSSSKG